MRTIYGAAAALLLLITGFAQADAPRAADILKRSMDRYDRAKSFQGYVQITMQKGVTKMQISMAVKAENDARGEVARSRMTVKSAVTAPGGSFKQQQIQLDDGRNLFVVDPINKKYVQQPRQADRLSKLFERSLTNIGKAGGTLSVSSRDVYGKPAYALTGSSGGANVVILVDKTTYDLRSLYMKRGSDSSKLTVDQQLFDQPIPASEFAWTPPKDYKLAQPQSRPFR